MSLEYVKVMTGVDNAQVDAVYNAMTKRVLQMIASTGATEVPDELDFVVDEVSIARFNYIGSEGMSRESVEGHTATYIDDLFKPYMTIIDDYIDSKVDPPVRDTGVVYFI